MLNYRHVSVKHGYYNQVQLVISQSSAITHAYHHLLHTSFSNTITSISFQTLAYTFSKTNLCFINITLVLQSVYCTRQLKDYQRVCSSIYPNCGQLTLSSNATEISIPCSKLHFSPLPSSSLLCRGWKCCLQREIDYLEAFIYDQLQYVPLHDNQSASLRPEP